MRKTERFSPVVVVIKCGSFGWIKSKRKVALIIKVVYIKNNGTFASDKKMERIAEICFYLFSIMSPLIFGTRRKNGGFTSSFRDMS